MYYIDTDLIKQSDWLWLRLGGGRGWWHSKGESSFLQRNHATVSFALFNLLGYPGDLTRVYQNRDWQISRVSPRSFGWIVSRRKVIGLSGFRWEYDTSKVPVLGKFFGKKPESETQFPQIHNRIFKIDSLPLKLSRWNFPWRRIEISSYVCL